MLTIVTRDVSGLLEPREGIPLMELRAISGLSLHHTGGTSDAARASADPLGFWREVQRFFLEERGLSDIAYNWMVLPDGRVYEGRGLRYRCAANGTNDGNLRYPSVIFPGDFRSATSLSSAQIGAFRQLRSMVRSVAPQATDAKPHSFFKPTECPGANIVNLIPELIRDPPSGGSSGARPVLRRGSQGSAVRSLQEAINGWGGARLLVDGDFGAATDTAVRRFQSAHGLVVDGVVGRQTWPVLERYASR